MDAVLNEAQTWVYIISGLGTAMGGLMCCFRLIDGKWPSFWKTANEENEANKA